MATRRRLLRLVAIGSPQERRALDDIVHRFGVTDCGPGGPEGNYRQRLYRLKSVLPEAAACDDAEAPLTERAGHEATAGAHYELAA